MNIESVLEKISLFEELVIQSGFKRDIQDFSQAIQQRENQNLVFMKDISDRVQSSLLVFENQGLEDSLEIVLRNSRAFTHLKFDKRLIELDANQNIDSNNYFNTLNNILNELISAIESNSSEIGGIKKVFLKYVSGEEKNRSESDQALVSLVFKDIKSTGTLKEFSKVLNRWDKNLLVFHTLLKSESPKAISLVEIQNGSIDVIFNIDMDIALDLTLVINTGFKVYAAYLVYKSKLAKEIIQSYMGNKQLIKTEKDRERLMLENIKDSMKVCISDLHSKKSKADSKIEKASVEKKIAEVSDALADHIIKGNEIKLLNPPIINEERAGEESHLSDLRKNIASVKERYKELSEEDKVLLIQKYSIQDDDG